MKRKGITLAILLVLLLGGVVGVFASDICSICYGSGTVCPFNSEHRINLERGEGYCPSCDISFALFNCRSCGGKGRK